MNIRMVVITHKQYPMPSDAMYLPVCVGEGKDALPYQRDDEGENIADRNYSYCELTGLYWAWKHVSADAVGICHYRRYFADAAASRPANFSELEEKLQTSDVLVTPRHHYYFYTNESHYTSSTKGYVQIHKRDIAMLRRAVAEVDGSYSPELEKILHGRSAHMLNMFVMKRALFQCYCSWLFAVVDRAYVLLADREDQWRYIGALSEMLLDVWLLHNHVPCTQMPIYETEKQPFRNRLSSFVRRKLIAPQGKGSGK